MRQPKRWKFISWEEMAQENPLFAVMSTEHMADETATDFSPRAVKTLFTKGRILFDRHLAPLIQALPDADQSPLIVEYGCGVGRILKSAVKAGWRCAGIDISPTMLEHCRRMAPKVEALYALDPDGRCALPDASASMVFSYAVVQHIASLTNYVTAIDEMCRILKPGGTLAVQVNCQDFIDGDLSNPGRTRNLEDHSLRYRPGETKAHMKHRQNQWSGVYIGQDLLTQLLRKRRVKVESWRYHHKAKPLGIWVIGKKAG